MKKILGLLAAIAGFFGFTTSNSMITVHNMKVHKDSREAHILKSTHQVEPPRPNGLQLFQVGEQQVWALNRKNAERKAKLYPDKDIIGG